ncbi:MAG: hypothetical protein KA319_03450 [Ferruginibacter sp.]|nr:hypothetical protein [Ferruginibacter sp.]
MKKSILVITVLFISILSSAQTLPATCSCEANNIATTGNIAFVKVKKYSPTLTTYNYKSNIIFTNNTNCKMEIKSATIGDKITFLQTIITSIGDKKRSWIKNISQTKPLISKDDKAKVLFVYKLNGINCKQEILIPIQ